jgi:hypothetical protein
MTSSTVVTLCAIRSPRVTDLPPSGGDLGYPQHIMIIQLSVWDCQQLASSWMDRFVIGRQIHIFSCWTFSRLLDVETLIYANHMHNV